MVVHRLHMPYLFLILALCQAVVCQNGGLSAGGEGPDVITKSERSLVNSLRPLVENVLYKDYMKTDEYLVRFIRAAGRNLHAAKEKVDKAMAWRQENKMDTILTENFDPLDKEYRGIFEGVDNYGRPIFALHLGAIDVRKAVLGGNMKQLQRFFESILETYEATTRQSIMESGLTNLTRSFVIFDLTGFNIRQHACTKCLPIYLHFFKIYEEYYPEIFYKIYAINAPKSFYPVVEAARPLLSEPTRKGFTIFDHDTERWKKALLSQIPADQLPTIYGGTRTVIPRTYPQIRESNPFMKLAYEKALQEKVSIEKRQ